MAGKFKAVADLFRKGVGLIRKGKSTRVITAGTETETIATKRIGGAARIERPLTVKRTPPRTPPPAPKIGMEKESIASKFPKVGAGTGFIAGMTAADVISAITAGKDMAGSGGGGMYGGASPAAVEAYGDAALRSQRLSDKTALKIARLEARTRLRLAKIQRSRDMAMAYLSNPVVGIGLAYGTIVGVRAAVNLAHNYSDDNRLRGAFENNSTASTSPLGTFPILTMAGLSGLAGAQIPPFDIGGGLYNAAAQGGAFGLLPEMAQLAGLK